MTIHIKPLAVRLVAPGGPVSRAVVTMAAAHRQPVLALEIDPERAEIHRLKETIRDQIERDFDRIDRCLVILDALDGDPDLTADFTTVEQRADGTLYTLGRSSDDERHAEDEPSLGSLNGTGAGWQSSQARWSMGSDHGHGLTDLEGEHDGREPDNDDEDSHDREAFSDDNGIADGAGAWEQLGAQHGLYGFTVSA